MKNLSKFLTCTGLVMALALTGCGKGEINLNENAKSVMELSIPEGVKIVGLGEASHGNKEFQELKKEVFEKLVEDYGVKAYCMEGDQGLYKKVNAYIHSEGVTLDEAVEALNFRIYKTNTNKEFLEWLKEYNDTHEEKVSFYGFDMQTRKGNVDYLIDACKNLKSLSMFDADRIETTLGDEATSSNEEMQGYITELRMALEEKSADVIAETSKETYDEIFHALRCIEQNAILGETYANNQSEYSNVRDGFMAENVKWIYEHEKLLGNDMIFITGHNGHIGKVPESSFVQQNTLGSLLKEEYEDEYYCIGTDYYHTKANISSAGSGKRGNHSFTSGDPLAKLAKNFPEKRYLLQFNEIPETSELWNVVNSPMTMGSLGEGYGILMHVIKKSVRVNIIPTQKYDGMIFIYKTTPLDLIEK